MNVLIDNKDLSTEYGITVLDYTGALSFPAERENERIWSDKSGVDKNLENIRYHSKEFVLSCYCKAVNEVQAYAMIGVLIEYMFTKGVVVLSLRDSSRGIRDAFLCERSNTIVGDISVRRQNGLYAFKLGLKDINPNAVKYLTDIVANEVTVNYEKGRTSIIYWGNGDRGTVSNSGNYTKDDYSEVSGNVDVFIDIDKSLGNVTSIIADFSADTPSGAKELTVQFTDESAGTIIIWNWDFGDGNTSSEQNPSHVYTEEGNYTVSLQVFNDAQGFDAETKVGFISVRNSLLLINNIDIILINNTDRLLLN